MTQFEIDNEYKENTSLGFKAVFIGLAVVVLCLLATSMNAQTTTLYDPTFTFVPGDPDMLGNVLVT